MALIDNIVSYWKLDESSGNAVDATGNGYTLTNNNSVSYSPAKINNGADFGSSNSNKSLSTTSVLGLTSTSSYTIGLWVKLNTEISSGSFCFLDRQIGGNPGVQVRIEYEYNGGSRRLRFISNSASGLQSVNYTITLGTSNWYFFMITYVGGASGTLEGFVNNSSVGTTTANIGGGNFGAPNMFVLGSLENSQFWSSAIVDEVSVHSRVLTSDERTALYNSGSGLSYPFTTTNIKTLNGITKANVKTINGTAINNVKSINGIQ